MFEPSILPRLSSLINSLSEEKQIYEEYVLNDDEHIEETKLFQRTKNRLEQYGDEDPFFYLPEDRAHGKRILQQLKVSCIYLKTLKWLLEHGETFEILLLLYRGVEFINVFDFIKRWNYLDVVFNLMQLETRLLLDEMTHGTNVGDWLTTYDRDYAPIFQHASATGYFVDGSNETNYHNFKTHLLNEYGLSSELCNPWLLCDLVEKQTSFN